MTRNAKIGLIVIIVVAVLGGGIWWFVDQSGKAPGKAALRQAIELRFAGSGQKVLEMTTRDGGGLGDRVLFYEFSVTAEATNALYQQVLPAAYLQQQGADPQTFRRIAAILAGKGADRIGELAGVKGPLETLQNITLLKEVAPPGQHNSYTGRLRAVKPESEWQVSVFDGPTTDKAQPMGRSRGVFSGKVALLDRAEEADKVKQIVTNARVALQKLEQAQEKYRATAEPAAN